MHGGRAQDRTLGNGEPDWVEDERPCLRAAEPAVKRDQLLEGATLVEVGVVEAPNDDVRDVREAVRPQQVLRRVGEKGASGPSPSTRPSAR